MMKIGKLIITIIIILSAGSVVHAVDPLDMGTSARSIGLGGAFSALRNDSSGVFGNPSALASFRSLGLTSMFGNMSDDLKYTMLGITVPLEEGVIGAGYAGIIAPDLLSTTVDASGKIVPAGSFNVNNELYMVEYCFDPDRKMSYGFRLKYLRKGSASVPNGEGSGLNMDAGLIYRQDDRLTYGISLFNFLNGIPGSSIKWANGYEELLPLRVDAGVGLDVGIYSLLFDVSQVSGYPADFRLGAEYNINERLALRGGIERRVQDGSSSYENLSFGVGYGFDGLTVDYAYHHDGLVSENSRHYVALSYSFSRDDRPDFILLIDQPKISTTRGESIRITGKVDSSVRAVRAGSRIDDNAAGGYSETRSSQDIDQPDEPSQVLSELSVLGASKMSPEEQKILSTLISVKVRAGKAEKASSRAETPVEQLKSMKEQLEQAVKMMSSDKMTPQARSKAAALADRIKKADFTNTKEIRQMLAEVKDLSTQAGLSAGLQEAAGQTIDRTTDAVKSTGTNVSIKEIAQKALDDIKSGKDPEDLTAAVSKDPSIAEKAVLMMSRLDSISFDKAGSEKLIPIFSAVAEITGDQGVRKHIEALSKAPSSAQAPLQAEAYSGEWKAVTPAGPDIVRQEESSQILSELSVMGASKMSPEEQKILRTFISLKVRADRAETASSRAETSVELLKSMQKQLEQAVKLMSSDKMTPRARSKAAALADRIKKADFTKTEDIKDMLAQAKDLSRQANLSARLQEAVGQTIDRTTDAVKRTGTNASARTIQSGSRLAGKASGPMEMNVPLKIGINTITVSALDRKGKVTAKEIKVLRLASYKDVPKGYWGSSDIENLETLIISTGHGSWDSELFYPEKIMSRNDMLKTMAKTDWISTYDAGSVRFTDVKEQEPSYTYIRYAQNRKWVDGYPDEKFRPNRQLTRAEAVMMMIEYVQYDRKEILDRPPFKDVDKDHWAARGLKAAKELGIVDDTENFRPDDHITKAELYSLLARTAPVKKAIKALLDSAK